MKFIKQLVRTLNFGWSSFLAVFFDLARYIMRQKDKGENFAPELSTFFAGELNPVAPKAQKKVTCHSWKLVYV